MTTSAATMPATAIAASSSPLQPRPVAGIVPVDCPNRTRAGSWDSFERRYKPLPQSIDSGGCEYPLFDYDQLPDWAVETTADGKTYANYRHVWTVVEGDNGTLYACPGFHTVNRLGYLVCELPFGDVEDRLGYGYRY